MDAMCRGRVMPHSEKNSQAGGGGMKEEEEEEEKERWRVLRAGKWRV